MATEQHWKFVSKGRFLAKLSNKTYGIKSHKERIESDRAKEDERDKDVRVHVFVLQFVSISRIVSESKSFSTLGDVVKFKEAK